MPITESEVKRLTSPLEAVRNITSRKMFGGVGLYCDGVFFSVIDNDRLFFKVDSVTEADYDAFDADQWVIEGDPPSPMPYREVPAAILTNPEKLGAWIDAAVGVANRKKKPTKKAKA